MSSQPAQLAYGDDGYQAVYDRWVLRGRGGFVENLADSCLYRAVANDDGNPTFLLVCHDHGDVESTTDKSSLMSGYGRTMATAQLSWQGRRTLPK